MRASFHQKKYDIYQVSRYTRALHCVKKTFLPLWMDRPKLQNLVFHGVLSFKLNDLITSFLRLCGNLVWCILYVSIMGTNIFSLSHARDKTKKNISLFLYRAQNLPSLSFLSTNITLSTFLILAVCWTRVIWTLLKVESLWLSGRASERGIRRSEVRFLMGLRIFSLSNACDKMKNIFL